MLPLEDVELRILLGNSIPLPEMDYDDENVESEYGLPEAEAALRDYYFSSLTYNIGKEDFQYECSSVIDPILRYPLEDKIELCYSILKRLKIVHDFEFAYKPDIKDDNDVENILDLVKFIEYDCEKLIIGIWKYIRPDSSRVNFVLYCEQNKDKIFSELEEQIETHDFNPFITDFLKTYEGDKMIKWFCKQSERYETAIKIERLKE